MERVTKPSPSQKVAILDLGSSCGQDLGMARASDQAQRWQKIHSWFSHTPAPLPETAALSSPELTPSSRHRAKNPEWISTPFGMESKGASEEVARSAALPGSKPRPSARGIRRAGRAVLRDSQARRAQPAGSVPSPQGLRAGGAWGGGGALGAAPGGGGRGLQCSARPAAGSSGHRRWRWRWRRQWQRRSAAGGRRRRCPGRAHTRAHTHTYTRPRTHSHTLRRAHAARRPEGGGSARLGGGGSVLGGRAGGLAGGPRSPAPRLGAASAAPALGPAPGGRPAPCPAAAAEQRAAAGGSEEPGGSRRRGDHVPGPGGGQPR